MNQLLCPICKTPLIEGEKKTYVTWADDICDPNMEADYSKRPSLKCGKEDCVVNKMGFFDICGDWYGDGRIPKDLHEKLIELTPDKKMTALYGSSRKIFNEESKSKTILNLYFIKIYIEYRLKCDEMYGKVIGTKDYKLRLYYKCNAGYVQYTSSIHMFFFCLKQFNRNKKRWIENGNEYCLRDIKRDFEKDYDKRLWKKFFKWYINHFEKDVLKQIEVLETLSK